MYSQVKQAELPAANPDARRLAAAKQLLTLLSAGVATGAGFRALTGARNLVTDDEIKTQPSAQLPPTIQIGNFGPRTKIAAGVADRFKSVGDWLTKRTADGLGAIGFNPDTSKVLLNDWGLPLGVGTAGAGLYGGYRLADWLLKKEKERSVKSDLTTAEQAYRQALADQYRAAMQAKHAGDDLGITSLADHALEKNAFFPLLEMVFGKGAVNSFGNVWPGLGDPERFKAYKGLVHTAEGLAALGTGKVTYDWMRKKNKQELMNKALQKRQQQRALMSPSPIIAELSSETDAA